MRIQTDKNDMEKNSRKRCRKRFAALILCFSMLAGLAMVPTKAAEEAREERLQFKDLLHDSNGVNGFEKISLHHYDESAEYHAGAEVKTGELLRKDDQLLLKFTYHISTQVANDEIKADTPYYLPEVSEHIVIPKLDEKGVELTINKTDGKIPFGKLYADGTAAWVTFSPSEDTGEGKQGTVLADELNKAGADQLKNAEFHLNCVRAENPPSDASDDEKENNRYKVDLTGDDKFVYEIGYKEQEQLSKEAEIEKKGTYENKKISWQVDYLPYQNPTENGMTLDTPFEVRDIIDTTMHKYTKESAKIDKTVVPEYKNRAEIPENAEVYLLIDETEDGKQVLIFGGKKLSAVKGTEANPATVVPITYETEIKDELLLPGGSGEGKKVSNSAVLYAKTGEDFTGLDVEGTGEVGIPTLEWITKGGKTTRDPGNGAITKWTVTLNPNGFHFSEGNKLTLHDKFPDTSQLVEDSVKVAGKEVKVTTDCDCEEDCSFAITPIVTNGQEVTITYETKIDEKTYQEGTHLGENKAWATFQYPDGTGAEQEYKTPVLDVEIGNGEAGGGSDTAILRKSVESYEKTERMISWQATINPHKINLTSGTFIDDLSEVGGVCEKGHEYGLKVMETSGAEGDSPHIQVELDGRPLSEAEKNLVTVSYDDEKQLITVEVGNVGKKTVTLRYDTLICDPCAFAANSKKGFTNTITAIAMAIGDKPVGNLPKADATQTVEAKVLAKGKPVYDYSSHKMLWTVEVNEAGLPMKNLVLTDVLPEGLRYVEDSLKTEPQIQEEEVKTEEVKDSENGSVKEKLTIALGGVDEKTTLTFETTVNPEVLGFGGSAETIEVENTISMEGNADGEDFLPVSDTATREFKNHGLIKNGWLNTQDGNITYEVLINPFAVSLPDGSVVVDNPTKGLQMDKTTVELYKVNLTGTSAGEEAPAYEKTDKVEGVKVIGYNPETNQYKIQLPDSLETGSYVLVYVMDIIAHKEVHSNSVHFEGGENIELGGEEVKEIPVSGGGGGGGSGIIITTKKPSVSIIKTDSKNNKPLENVKFTLYEYNEDTQTRGLIVNSLVTDTEGKASFKGLNKNTKYVLEEEMTLPGYGSKMKLKAPPENVTEMEDGSLLIAVPDKNSDAVKELVLEIQNIPDTVDLEFDLKNEEDVPLAGTEIPLYTKNPQDDPNQEPVDKATVGSDGKVKFPGVRRGDTYYLELPDGTIIEIKVPYDKNEPPVVIIHGDEEEPDKEIPLDEYHPVVPVDPDKKWEAVLTKVSEDENKPLPGARFGLYADENCEVKIKEGITAEDGTIQFSGLIKKDEQAYQEYWIKELEAPEGYVLDGSIWLLSIENEKLTISNKPETKEPSNPDTSEPSTNLDPGDSDGLGNVDKSKEPGETKVSGSVKTGDENPVFGWIFAFLTSGSIIFLYFLLEKKIVRTRNRR